MDFEGLSRLGDRIDNAWRRYDYDTRVFPELARDELLECEHADFDLAAFAQTAASHRRTSGRPSDFGDARVVAFETPAFAVEVLVWHLGSTSIHEHAFCGAFQVLRGSSIHGRYRFEEERRLSAFVRKGSVESLGTELLTAGSVREIRPGPAGLCHSLFHLDAPSCSIVVRTPGEPEHFPQMDYFPPGLALAIQNADGDAHVRRARECVWMARRLGDEDLQLRTLKAALGRLDLFRALSVVVYMPAASRTLRARIVEEIPPMFHELEHAVRGAILRRWLFSDCVRLRAGVHDPTPRFVLAAAMNAPDADALRVLVEARFPGEDAFELVCREVGALMRTGHLSVGWENEAGEEPLLRSFLRGDAANASDEVNALFAQDSVLDALRPITQALAAS
jgi:hypothetical protein